MASNQFSQHCLRLVVIVLVCAGLLGSVLPFPSEAQVTTAITPTTGTGNLGTTVTQAGTTYTITGGTRPGNSTNLFHSFGQFSIAASNTANFSNDSGLTTNNILARVTGGLRSDIFGTIQTTSFGTANLYLLNPAGVVFGPTARLNVGGSVNVSTADYLRFNDGAKVFSNVSPNPSVLTAASPVAFGFLGPTPAGITITQNAGVLSVGSSSNPQTLSLIGGPIQINGSILLVGHGRIQIASVASAGEVIPSAAGQTPSLDVGSFTQLGEINLSNKAMLTVSSSSGGGTILIRGGKLVMNDSKITADTAGTANGALSGIDINIAGDIAIANPTTVNAGQGVIQASTQLAATLGTGGKAGDITVSAGGNLQLEDGSAITSFSLGKGPTGNVTVSAGTIEITGGSRIDNSNFGSGGTPAILSVTAKESISVSGKNSIGPSSIGSIPGTDPTSRNPEIFIGTPILQLMDGGQILANTGGSGRAGNVTVQATDSITISKNSRISSETTGSGSGGSINLNSGQIQLTNGAQISSSSTSTAANAGNAGTVSIAAGAFQNDGSTVTTSAKQGKGGDITITAGQAQLMNHALISATSAGRGDAGNISITAVDGFVLRHSTVTTQATVADGGNITIRAGEIVQLINSSITTSVGQGLGNGGNITIDPQFVILQSGSQILANAFGGNGGNIDITAGLLLISPDSVINASSALGVSGTITINSAISDLSGSLTPLPQGFVRKGVLLSSRCAARVGGSNSSFVVAGREAVPMEPGGLLPSPLPESGGLAIAESGSALLSAIGLSATLEAGLEQGCGS